MNYQWNHILWKYYYYEIGYFLVDAISVYSSIALIRYFDKFLRTFIYEKARSFF